MLGKCCPICDRTMPWWADQCSVSCHVIADLRRTKSGAYGELLVRHLHGVPLKKEPADAEA